MRMDHHCPWTGNCVGLKTHKYFMCFTFWTIVGCLHIGLSTPLLNKHITWNVSNCDFKFIDDHRPFDPLLVQLLSLSISIGIMILFCMHISFLKANHTTIECGELLIGGNPFNMGDDNFKQIMGPSKLTWFWPVMPGPTYKVDGKTLPNPYYLDGLSYPLNFDD